MKILIFSDSHGRPYAMREALRRHPDAEVIFFLGDGLRDAEALRGDTSACLLAVRGNCDLYGRIEGICVPSIDTITLCGHRILFTHGDAFGVKYSTEALIAEARAREADIVLFGHTHAPTERCIVEDGRPLWLFNPGSIGGGRDGRRTYGLLTLTEQCVLLSHGAVGDGSPC